MPTSHGAVIGPGRDRTLALPANPTAAVRATVVATPTEITVVGGYRFDADAAVGEVIALPNESASAIVNERVTAASAVTFGRDS